MAESSNILSLNQQAAAKSLGISTRTLQNWTREGKIIPAKVGRVTLYPVDAIREFLSRHQQKAG